MVSSALPCTAGRRQYLRSGMGKGPHGHVTYGDVFHQNEVEMSRYNFEEADVEHFCFSLITAKKKRAADEKPATARLRKVMKASHAFNLLDARHAISVTERQRFILRVRTLARAVALSYFNARAALGFPLARSTAEVLERIQAEELS